jgi:patatin-related protein
MDGLLKVLNTGNRVVPPEEIRFGVILNGGVSLAVWMGGAALELDRLVKAGSRLPQHARHHDPGRVYATMLKLAGCTARVDVIAGTSAGGINGAALALAQANSAADLSSLRDIWVDQGRIETLLRQPFRGAPTSLLRGDEFFLPQLNEALTRLAVPNDIVDRHSAPLDLTITTTVLGGNQTITVDSMGQRLPQLVHAGKFRWKRRPDDATPDPFAKHDIGRTANQLALASRSTASFPIAFEPSFVPVNPRAAAEKLHPDMSDVVREWGDRHDDRDHSRYVVDGGLLANTPTRDALRAVDAMPAAGPVRRVMLLVYPHAEPPGLDPAADPAEPPTVIGTVGALMDALTAQGSRTFVDELEAHNKVAAGRRGTRGDLVRLYGDGQRLDDLTEAIYPQYRRLRLWRAARDLAAQVSEGVVALPDAWNYERVRRAAESAQRRWETSGPVPYVPRAAPRAADVVPEDGWAWGLTTALGITEAAADVLRRLIWVLPDGDDYRTVEQARRRVWDLTTDLAHRRQRQQHRWTAGPLAELVPDEAYWTLRIAVEQRSMLGGPDGVETRIAALTGDRPELREAVTALLVAGITPGQAGREVRSIVGQVVEQVAAVLGVLGQHAGQADADDQLAGWRDLLTRTSPGPDQILARLLQLDVAGTTLGDEVGAGTGLTLPLEVVQLSAQTQNAFAQFTRTGNDKLGGMSVNRFGGFLKRSWRVNDWTWGRIDAATTLSRIVLQPARIRRSARLSGLLDPAAPPAEPATATATVEEILEELFHPSWRRDDRVRDLRSRAIDELTPVFDLTRSVEDLGASLPALADLFAWAQHLESVPAELPGLARAIRADKVDGANRRSRGELFLAENDTLLAALDERVRRPHTATVRENDKLAAENWNALGAFDRGGIGGEPLAEEGTSDQMIRTATTAAAVVATVVDSGRSGLGSIRVVTRPLRGAMLLPYWVVTGLSSRTALGRGLALLGLAFGGALLALSLFGVLPQILAGPSVALGAGAVLGALAFGAMRSGTMLHGLVLITPIVPLVAYATQKASEAKDTDTAARHGIGVLVAVLALLAGLMVLGSLPAATGSVFGALDRLADRQRIPRVWAVFRRPLGVLVVLLRQIPLVVLAGLVAGAVAWVVSDVWADSLQRVRDHLPLLQWIALGAVALGATLAFLLGRQLQVLRPTIVDSGTRWRFQALTHPAGATAGWSVLYGTGYLLIARFLLGQADWLPGLWARALLVTAALLGVLLVVVVPVGLPVLAIWRIFVTELARSRTVAAPLTRSEQAARHAMVTDMTARGVSYRVFMGEPDYDHADHQERDMPRLQRLGPVLHRRIQAARDKASR